MLFIEYPKCSTCKKAKKFLDDNKIAYTDRNIVQDNPTYEELCRWLQMSGLEIKKFFNTSGILYRSMNLSEKLGSMTDDEKLRLLSSDGMLVKRPLLITDDFVLTGFNAEKWKILLENN